MRRFTLATFCVAVLVTGCDDTTDPPVTSGPGPTTTTGAAGGGTGGTGGDAGMGGMPTGGMGGGGMDPFDPIVLTSSAFADNGIIPEVHECLAAGGAAANQSPPLSWTGGPDVVGSWGIVARDVDVDDGGEIQWAIWNIPGNIRSLPAAVENAAMPSSVPSSLQATSYDMATVGYIGPCVAGNRFRFSVFAMEPATLPGLDASTHRVTLSNYLNNFSLADGHLRGESN